jgi:hypothetical protein
MCLITLSKPHIQKRTSYLSETTSRPRQGAYIKCKQNYRFKYCGSYEQLQQVKNSVNMCLAECVKYVTNTDAVNSQQIFD